MLPTGPCGKSEGKAPGQFSSRAAAGEPPVWVDTALHACVQPPGPRAVRTRPGCAQSSRVEWSSSVVRMPRPSPEEFCATEAVRTVWRRMRTSTHSLSRPGHSLVAEDTVRDALVQEALPSTVPLDCTSLLMSQHSGSSLVRKVS